MSRQERPYDGTVMVKPGRLSVTCEETDDGGSLAVNCLDQSSLVDEGTGRQLTESNSRYGESFALADTVGPVTDPETGADLSAVTVAGFRALELALAQRAQESFNRKTAERIALQRQREKERARKLAERAEIAAERLGQ